MKHFQTFLLAPSITHISRMAWLMYFFFYGFEASSPPFNLGLQKYCVNIMVVQYNILCFILTTTSPIYILSIINHTDSTPHLHPCTPVSYFSFTHISPQKHINNSINVYIYQTTIHTDAVFLLLLLHQDDKQPI